MAVLWKQREMVRELKDLEYHVLGGGLSLGDHGWDTDHIYKGDGTAWVYENQLMDRMMEKHHIDKANGTAMADFKRLINSCIDNKFFLSKSNEQANSLIRGMTPASPDNAHLTSQRCITVSPDEGEEILNNWYFLFKYVASELPPLANIAISVVTAVLTSGAIWLFLLNYVGIKIGE